MGHHENGASVTVAEAYLSVLRDRGVSRLFVNAGTDYAPFVEAYAHQKETGLDLPEVVICAHENLAVSMAHGAYLGDGRVQSVMVHTSVGTANAVCGVYNAATDQVPILLAAGRTPLFEDSVLGSRNGAIHWAQEMYDQASMLREFVKWDYELRDGVHVAAVLDRGVDIAMAAPRGPVYLSLPREVLARDTTAAMPPRATATPTDPAPDPAAVERLADLLADAKFPVFVTAATGRDAATPALLGQVCDDYSIAVLESRPRAYNVDTAHPLHLGYDLNAAADADVLVFLDMDVPWIAAAATPPAGAVIVQTGPDAQYTRYPIRTHRSDLSVTTTTGNLLTALAAALSARAGRIDRTRRAPMERIAIDSHTRIAERLEAAGQAKGPINKAFMNWALAQVLTAGHVGGQRVHRAPRPGAAHRAAQLLRHAAGRRPRLGRPGRHRPEAGPARAHGHLGRRRRRLHVRQPGGVPPRDGHARPAGADDRLREPPVDRGAGLGARHVPGGLRGRAGQLSPLAELGPAVAFEQYATAAGGYGEAVTERADLVPALRRALHAVQSEHRQAVLNVACAD